MEMNLYRTVDMKKGTVKMHGSYITYMPNNEKEAGIIRILSRYGLTLKKDVTHKANKNCFWIGREKGGSVSGIKLWDITVPFLMRGINKLMLRGNISEVDCGRLLCSLVYYVNVNKQEKIVEFEPSLT